MKQQQMTGAEGSYYGHRALITPVEDARDAEPLMVDAVRRRRLCIVAYAHDATCSQLTGGRCTCNPSVAFVELLGGCDE
jgi:hypothetical protein